MRALFILSLLLSIILLRCTKEFSCERCYTKDTFITPPLEPVDKWPPRDSADTTYNDLIAYYDFYIVDNSKIKKQYFNVQDKYIPGHFNITDTIPIQTTPDGYYNGFFNIKKYYDMSKFTKGDKFSYFFDIRYKNGTNLFSDTVTLIY